MNPIPDDPIISCMERTGYPPWYFDGGFDDEDNDDNDFDEEEEDGEDELF